MKCGQICCLSCVQEKGYAVLILVPSILILTEFPLRFLLSIYFQLWRTVLNLTSNIRKQFLGCWVKMVQKPSKNISLLGLHI